MPRRIPKDAWYTINDPKNFYAAMAADVRLLFEHRAYLSLTTIIVCCLDALAAEKADASKPRFSRFVVHHFPGLIAEIERVCPGKPGATLLYEQFRNGFAHLRAPKSCCAIAEDHELEGHWADLIEVPGRAPMLAINVDRFAKDFLALVERLSVSAAESV
jgi:hypothetical protein